MNNKECILLLVLITGLRGFAAEEKNNTLEKLKEKEESLAGLQKKFKENLKNITIHPNGYLNTTLNLLINNLRKEIVLMRCKLKDG